MNRVCILIPAFNPNDILTDIVNSLSGYDIFVVDDGSNNGFDFSKLNARIIHHKVNLGKGEALKTALYEINSANCYDTVVTVDADGQHLIEDILSVIHKSDENNQNVVLGCRNFKNNTPLRSQIGNYFMRFLFRFVFGLDLRDTQTGLRAIPIKYIEKLLSVQGSRYDYETAVLFSLKNMGVVFVEVPINTVYISDNKDSHYSPVTDSIKILAKCLRGGSL